MGYKPVKFETTLPFSCFDEEENQYLLAVTVSGDYYPPVEGSKNPYTADSDWDAFGLQSFFDYKVVGIESTENKRIKDAWIETEAFQIDLYEEVKDYLYETYEKDFDGFITEGKENV